MKRRLIPASLPTTFPAPLREPAATINGTPARAFGLMPSRVVEDDFINRMQPGQFFTLQPMDYPLTVAAGDGALASTQIVTPSGWDHFVLFQIGYGRVNAVSPVFANVPVSIRMRDLSTNDLMFNRDTYAPFSGVFGYGYQPRRLAMPWVIPANSNILIEVRNNLAANGFDLFMQFTAVRKAVE